MVILKKEMGSYLTNCYILKFDDFEFIIDPGINSAEWVFENSKNPQAIFLTHGHFDHFWDSYKIAQKYNISIYVNFRDEVLLQKDIFNLGIPSYQSEFVKLLNDNAKIKLFDIEIIFHHFPGHSEGSSLIEIEKTYFSRDLIFKGSIGRFDFPFSNALKMKNSLKRVLELDKNFPVYPGHGLETTIKAEEENLIRWIH